MNEIDPLKNSNGTLSTVVTAESHQESANSPLLSSLLATPKYHETISNGQQQQQQQQEIRANDLIMPSSVGSGHRNASAIVANPQYEEKISPKRLTTDKELDLSATTHSHKKFNNLSELLQRNNNNSETSTKSILENCLLKPSPVKTNHHRLESQYYHHQIHNKMDETGTSSSLLKFASASEESRKVEPLKINLNREPIRTVIKLPPNTGSGSGYESPTKITIKSPQPPPPLISNTGVIPTNQSISPTLSSSSSFSSESSYDHHFNDSHHHHHHQKSSIQVVPKLHLRNLLDTSLNHEQSELTIVPKLTITGLNSSQEKPQIDHSVNSILESQTIPKLTLKKDNNSTEAFYHLNNETSAPLTPSAPKRKTTNHHHHHNAGSPKLTIKQIPEQSSPQQTLPPVPKLTIKTTDNDTMTVINSTKSSYEAVPEHHHAIPKITIKANQVKKPHIRPLPSPTNDIDEDSDLSIIIEPEQLSATSTAPVEESIPKLTLKAVHTNSGSSDAPTFEKVVPKLVVKLPKDPTIPIDEEYEKESSSASSTPSPPLPHVSKLNIKPIPFPEKEVPIKEPVKNCVDQVAPQQQQPAVKFSINRLIGNEENEEEAKPLEINTSSIKSADSGQDSPRIILKINKTSNESTITETPSSTVVVVNSNKRAHSNDSLNDKDTVESGEDNKKRPKLAEDVIVIDSDASNEASNHTNKSKNHNSNLEANHNVESEKIETSPKETECKSVAPTPTRSLRNRRNNEVTKKPVKTPALFEPPSETSQSSIKEDLLPTELDPLALSNDATNSNSVDELITPKRGRGRPKKPQLAREIKPSVIELDSESRDPLEIPAISENSQEKVDNTGDGKKTPGRGRGRGRGRLKRTVEVIKNGKPIQITLEGHDDDDSPSFSIYNRSSLRGGLTKRPRGGKTTRGGKSSKSSPFITPERSKDGIFTTPSDNSRRKIFTTPSLFEEDTRMSIGGGDSQTPLRSTDLLSNEESQSSILSSTSNTIEGSVKKRSKKMEVCEPEGRTEFTIDMLAEYDWPQNEPPRNRETYMIQEQIAEYLGVKSFKRKYPDLVRRPVDMEERNYLFENGLASEKMCDLGLTAVYSSEILDIMCNDYPEKYEEYKRYQREKAFRNARLRTETAIVDRSQMQKDKAISSASEWNTRFNKDRRENRRCCMDLQNFLIQKPTPVREYKVTPTATYRTAYPVSLVPGQFSEYYEKYTPEQLACLPINSVLIDFKKLEEYLAKNPNPYESSDESDSDSSGSADESDDERSLDCESDTDSSSGSSSDEEYEDPKCRVCSQTPFTNRFNKPEKLITCSTCKHQAHPSCIEMSQRMYVRSLAYKWQCSSCKTCVKCQKQKDNKMLFCIQCDRGYHIYCLGLRNVPEGQYHCVNCTICSECGAKSPEGHFNSTLTQQQRQDLAMIAEWNHEFTTNPLTNIREHKASLCLPCFRKMNPKD